MNEAESCRVLWTCCRCSDSQQSVADLDIIHWWHSTFTPTCSTFKQKLYWNIKFNFLFSWVSFSCCDNKCSMINMTDWQDVRKGGRRSKIDERSTWDNQHQTPVLKWKYFYCSESSDGLVLIPVLRVVNVAGHATW